MTNDQLDRGRWSGMVWMAAAAVAAGCGFPADGATDVPADDPDVAVLAQPATTVPAWRVNTAYAVGARVRFDGIIYECRQAHRSITGWQPPRTPALWQRPTPSGLAPWTNQTHYVPGSQVTFGGQIWVCKREHVSQIDFLPGKTPSLWGPPNRPPSVTILSLTEGSHHLPDVAISLRAAVSDPDQAGTFAGRVVWSSDLDGPLCQGLECLSPPLRAGRHLLTVVATDREGASASATVSIVVNTPPSPAIVLPPEGAAFLVGQAVHLRGSARDPEQEIAGLSLVWSSHLDGPLGSGQDLSTGTLSPGTHRITLTASDDFGAVGSASVSVLIAPLIGPPSVLIHEPPHGTRIITGTAIHLVGLAFDPEDGLLPDAALSWSSDVDGPLGTGNALDVVLSGPSDRCGAEDRLHRVSLTVTDSDGNDASFHIVVRVGPAC